jgi:undecaprenyl diphosphate synthase
MLMLQTGYSQLYFTKTFWPDFDNNELKIALNNYEQREKRQGK